MKPGRSALMPLVAAALSAVACGGVTAGPTEPGAPPPTQGSAAAETVSPSGPTIAGTWLGSWTNDNGLGSGGFVLVATQKGKAFSGTIEVSGPTCVRQGTVQGLIDGTNVSWGVVAAERDVDFEGTLTGDSMSGAWSAIACGPPDRPANVVVTVTGTWEATRQE